MTENEDAIISSLLAFPAQSTPYVCSEIRPDHLSAPNAVVYREILGLFSEGQDFDLPSVIGRLRDKQKLEDAGGAGRLATLFGQSSMPATLNEHVRAVKDKAAQRRATALLRDKLAEIQGPGCDVSKTLSDVMAGIEEIGQDRARKKTPTMKALVQEAIGRLQKRYDQDEAGVSTGIPSLDRETGGLRQGSQWVIAGPAKGGKSSLAATLLASLAVSHNKRCAFFGLEMPSVENVERLICQVGRISASAARDGTLNERDFPNLTQAAAKLAPAPIMFRDDIFDLAELIGTARQMKAAFPDLFAIFVDYAQLLGVGHSGESREREVAIISRTLRKLSMQQQICIVLLSQVNDDGKLRESRSLGMDATTVVFIEFADDPGVRKLRLVQRNGRSGVELQVAYVGEHFQFADLARTR